jgi:hypothetical protein
MVGPVQGRQGAVGAKLEAKAKPKPKTPAQGQLRTPAKGAAEGPWTTGKAGAPMALSGKPAITEGLPYEPGVIRGPAGYSAHVRTEASKTRQPLSNGAMATLEYDFQTVAFKGQRGGPINLKPLPRDQSADINLDLPTIQSSFKDLKKLSPDAAAELPNPDWFASRKFSTVGGAGHLASLAETNARNLEADSNRTTYNTYDARTGNQVRLSELLTKKQLGEVVATVSKKLPGLKYADTELRGSAWPEARDPKALAKAVDENFALTTGRDGKLKIEVLFESGARVNGDLTAHFTFDAPTDKAFRAKVGLDAAAVE